MAARDRYTSKIKCPNCKEKGILHISEDDYPFMKKLHREVDKVDGKFNAAMEGAVNISIICNECGYKFIL